MSADQSQPEVDPYEMLASLSGRLEAMEAQLAEMRQTPIAAAAANSPSDSEKGFGEPPQLSPESRISFTFAELAQAGYHPGICDSLDCRPCVSAHARMLQTTVTQLQSELDDAVAWAGVEEAGDIVSDALARWVTRDSNSEALNQSEGSQRPSDGILSIFGFRDSQAAG